MAKRKKAEEKDITPAAETPPPATQEIFPNGAHFGVVQLPIDLMPKPAAQRIVQWVNRDGKLEVYITENAYHRNEMITWYDKLMRLSYQHSISKGSSALFPVRAAFTGVSLRKSFAGRAGDRG